MNDVTQTALGIGEIPRATEGKPRSRIRRRISLLVSLGAIALAVIGGGLIWSEHSAPPAPDVHRQPALATESAEHCPLPRPVLCRGHRRTARAGGRHPNQYRLQG